MHGVPDTIFSIKLLHCLKTGDKVNENNYPMKITMLIYIQNFKFYPYSDNYNNGSPFKKRGKKLRLMEFGKIQGSDERLSLVNFISIVHFSLGMYICYI